MCACVCACACVCMCVWCVCACERACVRARVIGTGRICIHMYINFYDKSETDIVQDCTEYTVL